MDASGDPRNYEILSFGPFRLAVAERLLVKGDAPVTVGGRSLDILIALIEQAGEVVSTQDLLKRVWPDVTVEESNLRVHVAHLRKALGDGLDGIRYIINVCGRGYSFVAPVVRLPSPIPTNSYQKLPPLLARMIGRDGAISTLRSQLICRRFVSIVGPGGMGKTTAAVAVAHTMREEFSNAVFFVDLLAVTDAAQVAGAVGSALGCFIRAQDPVPSLLASLAGKRLLLILDNCEHVIEPVATLTERLFGEAPLVHLLTTSREALRVEGETIHLLPPLDSPLEDDELTAAQALTSPAVQLFMERASAGGYPSTLKDGEAPIVAEICRRLDGIALAIELVASRVAAYGIQGTADLLDSRFELLWQGRRSALPRHQTLCAMLDWSYDLLSEHEKTVLCKLSVFVGPFTFEGALAVAGEAGGTEAAAAVASLLDRSLLWTSELGGTIHYRMAETTRTYAVAKLAESPSEQAVRRHHALHCTSLFGLDALRAAALGDRDMSAWTPHLGNVRAALDWSFSSAGDPGIGVELAGRSAPLFLGLSLLNECEHWCKRGLAALPEVDRDTKRELALREGLAISSMFIRGNTDEVRTALVWGLHLAEALGDRYHQLRLLTGLNLFLVRSGDFRAALAFAERGATIADAVGDPDCIVMAEWILGVSHHLAGDQAAAQCHCERGFELAAAWGLVRVDCFGYDHRVRALIILARALWLRGRPERGCEVAHQAIEEATGRDQPVTLCIALAYMIPVFRWTGEVDGVEGRIERLIAHAAKHSVGPCHAIGLALKGEFLIARGEAGTGVQLLLRAMATLRAERYQLEATGFYRALADGLARCGQFEEASAAIAEGLALAEQRGGTFDLPELLRTQAEINLAGPRPDATRAEASLLAALDCARKQSALGWELRAAIALARLLAQRGDADRARDMLAGVYEQFSEGFETTDLKAAARLLAELGHCSQESACG